MSIRIFADENIPDLERFIPAEFELIRGSGRDLRAGQLTDVDALLVRSVTQVNASLLTDTKVKFVGSATIGIDHIDVDYLTENAIGFANAPGSNANSVAEYVIASLLACGVDLFDSTLSYGVIGAGNVGSAVIKLLRCFNIEPLVYDPLNQGADFNYCSFDQAIRADLICCHTPLTTQGPFPSQHLLNAKTIAELKPGTVLLNAGRGGVIDNQALLMRMQSANDLVLILDVWENEPDILMPLLSWVRQGTPHIAGYSYDGKVQGTRMVCAALLAHFDYERHSRDNKEAGLIPINAQSLSRSLLTAYNPQRDAEAMFNCLKAAEGEAQRGMAFDSLRKSYPKRLEWSNYQFGLSEFSAREQAVMAKIIARS